MRKLRKVRHSRSKKELGPWGFKGKLVSCKTVRKRIKREREQGWKANPTPLNIHRLMSARVGMIGGMLRVQEAVE